MRTHAVRGKTTCAWGLYYCARAARDPFPVVGDLKNGNTVNLRIDDKWEQSSPFYTFYRKCFMSG